MESNIAYNGMPLSDAMQRQRERLFARMTHYAENGAYSALVTKETGLQGVFWMIVIRKGSEVIAKDIHYAGPDHAQRRADQMLSASVPRDVRRTDTPHDHWNCPHHMAVFGYHVGIDGWTYIMDDFGNAMEVNALLAEQNFIFHDGTNEGYSRYVPAIL
jgi:hypothetical protein